MQASVSVTLKCKTLERKVKFFYPLFSILKPLQCEALEKILNSDNFKNLTTKPPCENCIKLYSWIILLISIDEAFG